MERTDLKPTPEETIVAIGESEEVFTKEEAKIMGLLVSAHNKFIEMERLHPSEMSEWVLSFHRLQSLLGARVLIRNHPDIFNNQTK